MVTPRFLYTKMVTIKFTTNTSPKQDPTIVLQLWNPELMLLTIHTSCVVLSNLKHCQTRTKKKNCISCEIISNVKKRQNYFALYCHNKIPKDFYTHFRNFVTGQIRRSKKDQRRSNLLAF